MTPVTTSPIPRRGEIIESGAFVADGIAAVPVVVVIAGLVERIVVTVVAVTFLTPLAGKSSTPVFENISSAPIVLNAVERAIAAALS